MRRIRLFVILLIMVLVFPGFSPEGTAGKDEIQLFSTAKQSFPNIYKNSKVKPMVSAGFNFSVILKEDGTVWSCGVNLNGQMGIGKTGKTSTLVRVKGLSNVIKVDTADDYVLALKDDGTVWGWGDNYMYELGAGKPESTLYASQISELTDVKDIAAANGYSFFLKNDGTVWYMGGRNDKYAAPKKFKELSDIVAIASKHMYGMALKKDGTVWTWSFDYKGGGAKSYCSLNLPSKVQGISGVKLIEAGDFHYMAVKKDGTLWVWGDSTDGQIGDGTLNGRTKPYQIKGITNVVTIGTGFYSSMATQSDGTYWVWGENESGQYGNGTKKTSLVPIKMSKLTGIISVSGGYSHTIALKGNGEIYIMGLNYDGILGTGDKKDRLTPYKLLDLKDKTDMSGKEIIPNGSLTDWGEIEPIARGEQPEDSKKFMGIEGLYAKKDGKYLYLAAKLTKGTPLELHFNLDFNGDGESDYSLIFSTDNRPLLFRFNSKGRTDDGYGVYGSVVETRVALADLGKPKKIYVSANFDMNLDNFKELAPVSSWYEVTE